MWWCFILLGLQVHLLDLSGQMLCTITGQSANIWKACAYIDSRNVALTAWYADALFTFPQKWHYRLVIILTQWPTFELQIFCHI